MTEPFIGRATGRPVVAMNAYLGHCVTCEAEWHLSGNGHVQGRIQIIYDDDGWPWFQPHNEDCPRLSWPHRRTGGAG